MYSRVFKQIDKSYKELAFMLRLNRMERFKHIEFPASLPNIFTGLRLGFGYSWRALVGAELIAASSGLGYLIGDASEMSRTDKVFVGILCIAVLGVFGRPIISTVWKTSDSVDEKQMVTGVTLKGICKSFQSRGRVVSPLKDFSLNLEPGKLTAV